MRKIRMPQRGRARLLVVVGAAAAVAGITGAVQAAIPDGSGVIHGCYSAKGAEHTNGTALKIVDSATASCAKGETPITWNQTGRQPVNVTVDCPGQSIQQAIDANAGAPAINITINGTCTESVSINSGKIGSSAVTLQAGPSGGGIQAPSPNCVLCIGGARNVSLQGLALSGGDVQVDEGAMVDAEGLQITDGGVNADNGSVVTLGGVTMSSGTGQCGVEAGHGSSVSVAAGSITGCGEGVGAGMGGDVTLDGGVTVTNSDMAVVSFTGGMIDIEDATVSNSSEFGVFAYGGGSVNVTGPNTLITGSGGSPGVQVSDGGTADVENGATVSGNAGGGISADNGSHLLVQGGPIIENNQGNGISLSGGATMRIQGQTVVSGNSGDGIHISDTSVASFGGPNAAQITGNTGYGVGCDGPPSLGLYGGNPTVSGNTQGGIAPTCHSTGG